MNHVWLWELLPWIVIGEIFLTEYSMGVFSVCYVCYDEKHNLHFRCTSICVLCINNNSYEKYSIEKSSVVAMMSNKYLIMGPLLTKILRKEQGLTIHWHAAFSPGMPFRIYRLSWPLLLLCKFGFFAMNRSHWRRRFASTV